RLACRRKLETQPPAPKLCSGCGNRFGSGKGACRRAERAPATHLGDGDCRPLLRRTEIMTPGHADVRERCRRPACRQFAWQECHKSCAAHMPRTLPEPGCQRRVYVPLRATWGMPRAIDLIGFAIGNQATACEQGRRGRPFLFGEQAMRGL